MELNIIFPENNQVIVELEQQKTNTLNFISPLSEEDQKDIQWYLEVYGISYTTEVDDKRAEKIGEKLKEWGAALFNAVFQNRAAQRIFNDFQDEDEEERLLTINASHPAILSLPWELLRDSEGTYLVHDNPRISIRRRLAGARGGRRPFRVQVKDSLRLLFVVSRPSGAGFIDPRGEAQAVLDAIAQEAAGRIEVEFLRPATLANLVKRLEDTRQPPIDIVHFDGHGGFDAKVNTGSLLFENQEGKKDLISAETLGDMLNRQRVALIVLSACQSAAVGGEEAMGCVAARLTHAGIPTVLAMTYSVLVTTTRQLFAKFYENLLQGKGTGEALDNARRDLYLHQGRGERRRGEGWMTLRLQDWFLPALYQAGKDTALLSVAPHPLTPSPTRGEGEPEYLAPLAPCGRGAGGEGNNLRPLQEAGFFGRKKELWQIERWFVQGTRRLTVSGFGGQGKTFLVEEAGRWLHRTGMFEKVCFVDYAAFQGVDALGLAVSTLATVLQQSFVDVAAATQALRQHSTTLVILDNLETLSDPTLTLPLIRGGNSNFPPLQGGTEGGQPLRELLDAAKQWSEIGNCRVLLTSRTPDFAHPDYATAGSLKHRSLELSGLAPQDAVAYFQSLMKLPPEPQRVPPKRKELLLLFHEVQFHPLSIGLLANQLKVRSVTELGQRLEVLIAETPGNPLLASLNLSLERLDAEVRQWLPQLGVFQGGAMESTLLEVTELSELQLHRLRLALEATGLIQPEYLLGFHVPYLKFHPTLAPDLWLRLSESEQVELLTRHRLQYYQLAHYLYVEDVKNPHEIRAIAQKELPNLLVAVHGALDAGGEWAVDFVDKVNKFLDDFGLNREQAELNRRLENMGGEVGSQTWYVARSNVGEQFRSVGRYEDAAQVFNEILTGLGEELSYERCSTFGRLGRCFLLQGQPAQAAKLFGQVLEVAQQLEVSEGVKRLMGSLQAELADALMDMGDYGEARLAYQASLNIYKELGDIRDAAVVNGQLGTLALRQGNLAEAEQHFREALTTFQQLGEPKSEARSWHQLGRVYEEAQQWDAAEHHYREAARIKESQGDLAGAATTWNQLAMLNAKTGKLVEAEAWCRKAIESAKAVGDKLGVSTRLSNLAYLLQNQPNRLPETRQLAEEALAIKQTLDSNAAEIWTTYSILAEIADKQQDTSKAKEYRRLMREAKAAFAGTKYALQKYEVLIAGVVAAVDDAEVRQQIETVTDEGIKNGIKLASAIHRFLEGERDVDVLCESLSSEESMVIYAILRGVAESMKDD